MIGNIPIYKVTKRSLKTTKSKTSFQRNSIAQKVVGLAGLGTIVQMESTKDPIATESAELYKFPKKQFIKEEEKKLEGPMALIKVDDPNKDLIIGGRRARYDDCMMRFELSFDMDMMMGDEAVEGTRQRKGEPGFESANKKDHKMDETQSKMVEKYCRFAYKSDHWDDDVEKKDWCKE